MPHIFRKAEYVLVGFILLVCALILTDFTIFRSGAIFTHGIGDATSGFVYLFFLDKDWNPAWAYTHMVNFPVGHALANPVYVTWFLVMAPMWILAKLSSPIFALNLMTIIGYVTSGLVTYWLVKRLTGKWHVAAFAAYGVAFVPYHIMKSSDHLTNLFNWVVVAGIAAFVGLWRKQTKKRVLALAVVTAAAFYTDGYYILITGVLFAGLLLGLVVFDVIQREKFRDTLRRFGALALSMVIAVGLLLPIAFIQITNRQQISNNLSNSRGDIQLEAQYYGAHPIDFLLPPYSNPIAKHSQWVSEKYDAKKNRSNTPESMNYVGYTVILLSVIGGCLALYYSFRLLARRKVNKDVVSSIQVIVVCLIASFVVTLFMLPPTVYILGHNVHMPMTYVLDITSYWRVPSRLFLALQPLMVVAAAMSLHLLLRKQPNRRAIILAFLCIAALAVEYYNPVYRPPFNQNEMPHAYAWIAQQKDIHAIAELPFMDRPIEVSGYYAFAQMIHKKPIVNTPFADNQIGAYNALGSIESGEAINFIRERGADTVITHGQDCAQNPEWGSLVYVEKNALMPPYLKQKQGMLCVYKVAQSPAQDSVYPYAKSGFVTIDYLDNKGNTWLLPEVGKGTFDVVNSSGKLLQPSRTVRLTANVTFLGNFVEKNIHWVVSGGGKVIASGEGFGSVRIDAAANVSEFSVRFTVDENLTPATGELGLGNIQITEQ